MLTHLACIFVLSQQVEREGQLHKPLTWAFPGCGASLAFFSFLYPMAAAVTILIVSSTQRLCLGWTRAFIRLTRMHRGVFVISSDARTLFWVRLAAAKRCDLGAKTFHSQALFSGLGLLFQYELSPRKSNIFPSRSLYIDRLPIPSFYWKRLLLFDTWVVVT